MIYFASTRHRGGLLDARESSWLSTDYGLYNGDRIGENKYTDQNAFREQSG